MLVNPKKSIKLRNNTKYFAPEKDRLCVRFSSPETYQSRTIKIEGYETRLYWQFRDCKEHGGQTFFYTLTYNDNAMPFKYGMNCFDYEDLRDLFTGGFRKQLLRKYGTTFKYFVGAELGDGKGERGLHNNPHYHVLFFLEDAHNDRFPYRLIAPEQFRHLVRLYWQGFDEDEGKQDYRKCKYGIAKEGDNVGLVKDFRAISYVAKYVCKDVKLKMKERDIRRLTLYNARKSFRKSVEFNKTFFRTIIYDYYNISLNASCTEWKYNDLELLLQLLPEEDIRRVSVNGEVEAPEGPDYITYVLALCYKYKLWKEYNAALDAEATIEADEAINEWRNRFCNKCRISQGVGDYALAFIGDKLNPRFEVPGKKGIKARPMPMYYYRKLYTDVVIPVEVDYNTGEVIKYPPLRILNEDGINYKVHRLPSQIKKMAQKARNNFSLVIGNEELFNKMRNSDVNTEVFYTYNEFFERMNYLFKDAENNDIDIFERYAEYKLVYEDRHFSIKDCGDDSGNVFPPINPNADYRRFLVPSIYSVPRSDVRIDTFLKSDYEDYLSYNSHPYFLRYAGFFSVLDLCADYFFIQDDNKKQAEAEERAATKRFHTERDLKQFYKQFGL